MNQPTSARSVSGQSVRSWQAISFPTHGKQYRPFRIGSFSNGFGTSVQRGCTTGPYSTRRLTLVEEDPKEKEKEKRRGKRSIILYIRLCPTGLAKHE